VNDEAAVLSTDLANITIGYLDDGISVDAGNL
jgi:hypothetical protein